MRHRVEAAFRVQLVNVSILPAGVYQVVELVVVRSLILNLHHFIKHLFDNKPFHRSAVTVHQLNNLSLSELVVVQAESVKVHLGGVLLSIEWLSQSLEAL